METARARAAGRRGAGDRDGTSWGRGQEWASPHQPGDGDRDTSQARPFPREGGGSNVQGSLPLILGRRSPAQASSPGRGVQRLARAALQSSGVGWAGPPSPKEGRVRGPIPRVHASEPRSGG